MSFRIRMASPADAPTMLAIYAPFVRDTTVSFELEVPCVEEFAERIREHVRNYAHIAVVDEDTGAVAGYAYYSAFRERPAYCWSAEISVYLEPHVQGQGLGTELVNTLEELMRAQGIRMSEACITSSNDASISFHRRMGYQLCGEHHACGYKLGQWLSVVWMEKRLNPLDEPPCMLQPLERDQAEEIIAVANERLRKQ